MREFRLAWVLGLLLAAAAVVMALAERLPIRDPDNLLPGYIRMPAIVLGAIALDIVPRVGYRAARDRAWSARAVVALWRTVRRERWPASHLWFALSGVGAWYLAYAAFRNVKSMAPFVHPRIYDGTLADIDRAVFAGHEPAAVLHAWFGTGVFGHLMSVVYIVWIALVPVTIAIALVWTRNTGAGAWYVTALAVDWVLGAALYVAVPTVGPIYSDPDAFAGLPTTYVTRLQEGMWADRIAVLADPWGTPTLQTIAAFASLHVGIMVSICLCTELFGLRRWIRVSAWTFLGLTCLATVYLGWHFVVDIAGGVVLGSVAVWVAGLATGNRDGLRVRLRQAPEPASDERPAVPAGRSGTLPDHPVAD